MVKSETPGPGQYYNEGSQNYKFAYSKELRSKELKKGPPGPGRISIYIKNMIFLLVFQVLRIISSIPVYINREADADRHSEFYFF